MSTPSTTVGYSYDPLGRRIERSEGTDTQTYHLYRDTDLTDYQTDSEGALVLSSQRGADGLISTTDYSGQDPVTSYYSYNPHGDITTINDEAGTVTSTYRYDSFGSELSGSSPEYGYTGKWQRSYDAATETIQMGAREYDPALGRFTSTDPVKGTPTDPQQRNRYTYTSNNPLVRYDLSGFWYVNINTDIPIILGGGITIGLMANEQGLYPYVGGGITSGGVSITGSLNDPSTGLNLGLQLTGFYASGQAGESHGGAYSEVGAGFPIFGGSFTDYYVWGPFRWSMSDEEIYEMLEEKLNYHGPACNSSGKKEDLIIDYDISNEGVVIETTATSLDDLDYVWSIPIN